MPSVRYVGECLQCRGSGNWSKPRPHRRTGVNPAFRHCNLGSLLLVVHGNRGCLLAVRQRDFPGDRHSLPVRRHSPSSRTDGVALALIGGDRLVGIAVLDDDGIEFGKSDGLDLCAIFRNCRPASRPGHVFRSRGGWPSRLPELVPSEPWSTRSIHSSSTLHPRPKHPPLNT